jgi:predicted nucleotidyltransferase
MRFCEGDLVENRGGVIFDVKGLVHPPSKIIAFPRFIPLKIGERARGETAFKKIYALSDRFEFLRQNLPHYLVDDPVFGEKLCEVPLKDVKVHYKPVERLEEIQRSDQLDSLETQAMELFEVIRNYTGVPWRKLGISGSLLVRLHTNSSDIDPVVYGSENCLKVHAVLKRLLNGESSLFKPYNLQEFRVLFDFRSKDTEVSFEDFVRAESRKVLQGKFMQRDYFFRFVKDRSEISEKYGDVRYVNAGQAKLSATVVDDSESLFTPCTYRVDDVMILEGPKSFSIEEIVSFRGRFCEQAKAGEVVIAKGKVEHVFDDKKRREYYRLLLGNKPSDNMTLA